MIVNLPSISELVNVPEFITHTPKPLISTNDHISQYQKIPEDAYKKLLLSILNRKITYSEMQNNSKNVKENLTTTTDGKIISNQLLKASKTLPLPAHPTLKAPNKKSISTARQKQKTSYQEQKQLDNSHETIETGYKSQSKEGHGYLFKEPKKTNQQINKSHFPQSLLRQAYRRPTQPYEQPIRLHSSSNVFKNGREPNHAEEALMSDESYAPCDSHNCAGNTHARTVSADETLLTVRHPTNTHEEEQILYGRLSKHNSNAARKPSIPKTIRDDAHRIGDYSKTPEKTPKSKNVYIKAQYKSKNTKFDNPSPLTVINGDRQTEKYLDPYETSGDRFSGKKAYSDEMFYTPRSADENKSTMVVSSNQTPKPYPNHEKTTRIKPTHRNQKKYASKPSSNTYKFPHKKTTAQYTTQTRPAQHSRQLRKSYKEQQSRKNSTHASTAQKILSSLREHPHQANGGPTKHPEQTQVQNPPKIHIEASHSTFGNRSPFNNHKEARVANGDYYSPPSYKRTNPIDELEHARGNAKTYPQENIISDRYVQPVPRATQKGNIFGKSVPQKWDEVRTSLLNNGQNNIKLPHQEALPPIRKKTRQGKLKSSLTPQKFSPNKIVAEHLPFETRKIKKQIGLRKSSTSIKNGHESRKNGNGHKPETQRDPFLHSSRVENSIKHETSTRKSSRLSGHRQLKPLAESDRTTQQRNSAISGTSSHKLIQTQNTAPRIPLPAENLNPPFSTQPHDNNLIRKRTSKQPRITGFSVSNVHFSSTPIRGRPLPIPSRDESFQNPQRSQRRPIQSVFVSTNLQNDNVPSRVNVREPIEISNDQRFTSDAFSPFRSIEDFSSEIHSNEDQRFTSNAFGPRGSIEDFSHEIHSNEDQRFTPNTFSTRRSIEDLSPEVDSNEDQRFSPNTFDARRSIENFSPEFHSNEAQRFTPNALSARRSIEDLSPEFHSNLDQRFTPNAFNARRSNEDLPPEIHSNEVFSRENLSFDLFSIENRSIENLSRETFPNENQSFATISLENLSNEDTSDDFLSIENDSIENFSPETFSSERTFS